MSARSSRGSARALRRLLGCAALITACGEAYVEPFRDPDAGHADAGHAGAAGAGDGDGGPCSSPAFEWCEGRCVHVLSDDAHCGTCDQPCADDHHCVAGMCQLPL